MRNLIVHMMTNYCGEDAYEAIQVGDDWTNEQILDEAWYMACQHAESYGHPERDFEEEEDEASWDYEDWFSNNVSVEWEDYDPDKHDMLRSGGGSFSEDFR